MATCTESLVLNQSLRLEISMSCEVGEDTGLYPDVSEISFAGGHLVGQRSDADYTTRIAVGSCDSLHMAGCQDVDIARIATTRSPLCGKPRCQRVL